MNRGTLIGITLVLFALIAGGLVLVRQEAPKNAETAPPSNAKPSLPPAVAAKEVGFRKHLLVTHKSIAADDGDSTPVACEAVPQLFGYLTIDEGTTAELTCTTEYLGGIRMRYTDEQGEIRTLDLGQSEGDAGDMWDSRSLITRDETGKMRIDTLTFSSSDNSESEDVEDSCSVREAALEWDATTKSFDAVSSPSRFQMDLVTPPVHVASVCLDERGAWKSKLDQ